MEPIFFSEEPYLKLSITFHKILIPDSEGLLVFQATPKLNDKCKWIIKLSLCLIKHHAMKTLGSGGTAPYILST
jgi:hypothetical protein